MTPASPARTSTAAADLLVVGASARWWTASAVRAGWRVHAVDLFADRDLVAIAATAIRLADYPRGLPAAVAPLPIAPLTYTGALENHPPILAALARDRPLAGVAADVVGRVRDPRCLRRLARVADLPFPETRSSPRGVPRDGSYLLKPRASAGGHGITPWTDTTPHPPAGRTVWQRRIAGASYSATFLVDDDGAELVGVATQVLGSLRRGAGRFAWRGGIALRRSYLPRAVTAALARLGAALTAVAGLRGLVGVDFIVGAGDAPVLIEINPRPTASAELHERQRDEALAARHLACFGRRRPAPDGGPAPRPGCWAKALVRHHRACDAGSALLAALDAVAARWTAADGGWPALGDVPAPGTTVPPRAPLLTVFAHGRTAREAARALAQRSATIDAVLDRAGAAVRRRAASASRPGRRP